MLLCNNNNNKSCFSSLIFPFLLLLLLLNAMNEMKMEKWSETINGFPFELIVYRSLPSHRQYNLSSLTKSIPHRWDYYHQRNISRVIYVIFPTHLVTSIDNALEIEMSFCTFPSFINKSCLFYFMTLPDVSPERRKNNNEHCSSQERSDVRKNGWLFGLFCCWLQLCSLLSSCRYHFIRRFMTIRIVIKIFIAGGFWCRVRR